MKQITIEPVDFDEAVKQKWWMDCCLIAQCAKRNNISDMYTIAPKDSAARKLMSLFDRNFAMPGDEKKPELQALRASLPITVEI